LRATNPTFLVVYYRVYTENGLLLSKSDAVTDDPSLGRILGMAVTPPHTVLSLMKCLRYVEGFAGTDLVELFDSCAAQLPMDDSDRSTISLLTVSGPGSLEHEPLALVVRNGGRRRELIFAPSGQVSSSLLKQNRYRTQPSIAHVRHMTDCSTARAAIR
jgi:hypothetical protein